MSENTAIEWTDATWNPVSGCTKVSQGCKHCYAERVFPRAYRGREFTEVLTHPERLTQPLRWQKPRRIFVNSMSDLFHELVPFEFVDKIFAVMALARRHTFQVLTKRPRRMLDYLTRVRGSCVTNPARILGTAWEMLGYLPKFKHEDVMHRPWPLPNVHLGVSVEDQATADERIALLLQAPAAVRFLSCEPLLGPIDLEDLSAWSGLAEGQRHVNALRGYAWECHGPDYVDTCGIGTAVDWVIVGGESGPKARPMHPDWARSLRDQCAAAGVPFFFKQWGEWRPPLEREDYTTAKGIAGRPPAYIAAPDCTVHCFHSDYTRGGAPMIRVGKKAAGRLLDGREHSEFPA